LMEVLHARSVYEEATTTIDKLLEIKNNFDLGWNDFAILGRANDHLEPFLSELSKRGIPHMFVANRGLYRKPFILDLLAYLRLLDNFHESENLFRVFNMKKFKIADEELINLSQTATRKSLSLYEVLKDNRRNPKIEELLILLEKHTQIARNLAVSELLVRILQDLGYTKTLVEDSIENVENRNLLEKFIAKHKGLRMKTTINQQKVS